MLTDEILEKVTQRLVERINQGNEYIIKEIGKSIAEVGTVTPSKIHQLVATLKYGGSYEKIVKKLSQITKLNVADIYKIFEEVAKNDYVFAQQFYKYRNVDYIPWKDNIALQQQVKAIANITAKEYANLSKTSVLGYALKDNDGNLIFRNLKQTYYELIDEAVLNVSQGKETFDEAMYRKLKEVGESGLKVVYPTTYIGKDGKEHHYTRRLDSAISMNMRDGLKQLHNETQQIFGKEFKADGVEISVHLNPAPDHENVQGHQFSNKEFEKFQNDEDATSYDGTFYPAIAEETGHDRRAIGEYNCYHYIFSIVLGVSKPEYTNEQLQQIIETNNKGFDFEGKHYTNYQGTQLQRKLETEIRKAKDNQIIGKASKNDKLILESQQRITQLTNKYKELNKASGLPNTIDRARVSGYKRLNVNKKYAQPYNFAKYRDTIDNTKTLVSLDDKFDYEGFINEYNKFYNSLDKKEVEKTYKDYEKWCNNVEDNKPSQPIGKFLNKKLGYDAKPELINKKEFWIDEDGNYETDYRLLDKNHWYRGVVAKRYSEALKTEVPDIEKTKKYVEDFKMGNYYAGIGVNGNGTYATDSYYYATKYNLDVEEGMIYIMPKDNAKIIPIDKINYIKYELLARLPKKGDLYIDFANAIISDNGYLAELLGYDIIDLGTHKIILNRGAIKVVK